MTMKTIAFLCETAERVSLQSKYDAEQRSVSHSKVNMMGSNFIENKRKHKKKIKTLQEKHILHEAIKI